MLTAEEKLTPETQPRQLRDLLSQEEGLTRKLHTLRIGSVEARRLFSRRTKLREQLSALNAENTDERIATVGPGGIAAWLDERSAGGAL